MFQPVRVRRGLLSVLVIVLVTGLAAGADKTSTTTDTAAKPKTEEKTVPWFTRPNPFAPVGVTEQPATVVPPPALPADARPQTDQRSSASAAGGAEKTPPLPAVPRLNGIMFTPALPVAIVSDALVRVGDQVDAYRITSITVDTVTAEKDGVAYVMTTRRPVAQPVAPPKAAGEGPAEPPTPLPTDAPAPAAGQAPSAPAGDPQNKPQETQSSPKPQTADNVTTGGNKP